MQMQQIAKADSLLHVLLVRKWASSDVSSKGQDLFKWQMPWKWFDLSITRDELSQGYRREDKHCFDSSLYISDRHQAEM